jgi:hypothetical protein
MCVCAEIFISVPAKSIMGIEKQQDDKRGRHPARKKMARPKHTDSQQPRYARPFGHMAGMTRGICIVSCRPVMSPGVPGSVRPPSQCRFLARPRRNTANVVRSSSTGAFSAPPTKPTPSPLARRRKACGVLGLLNRSPQGAMQ